MKTRSKQLCCISGEYVFIELKNSVKLVRSDGLRVISWMCQIGVQGPHLCAKPCKFYMVFSKKAFFDLKIHVLHFFTSNSQN